MNLSRKFNLNFINIFLDCRIIKLLEVGIMTRLKKKWLSDEKVDEDDQVIPIAFGHVNVIFTFLILCYFISVLILIIELYKQRNKF